MLLSTTQTTVYYQYYNVYTDETIDHIIVYPAPTLLAYNAIDHATEHSIPLLLKPAPPSTIQCQY